jgi:hypothetical protein
MIYAEAASRGRMGAGQEILIVLIGSAAREFSREGKRQSSVNSCWQRGQ